MARRAAIRAQAAEFGIAPIGFTAPEAIPKAGERLRAFLDADFAGDMDWMTRRVEARSSPGILWPEVKSVIVAGMNYGPGEEGAPFAVAPGAGNISVYARGRDYHDVFKKRLKQLARWMVGTYAHEVKVFVDTAPVMEKPLAHAAGLGWQGKHTNMVAREYGSWLFLGAIFTTLKLAPDEPHEDRCGDCRACLDICPTDAFPAPYRLDARRCISYLTIEHKGHIPLQFRQPMGNRIYGCDDCLAACPWNKFAQASNEAAFHAREELKAPPLGELLKLDDGAFRTMFSGSPVKRTGRDRFLRNVLIAVGNSGDQQYLPKVKELVGDASPLVRAAAVWAASRLMVPADFAQLRADHADECDSDVRAEWADSA